MGQFLRSTELPEWKQTEVADNNSVITDGITETIANNHKTRSRIMGEYNLLNNLSNI